MELLILILRLAMISVMSAIFGLERQTSHKPIGFSPFVFVSVGSCGLAITATTLFSDNPVPLFSSAVTGIGFLGAGALIKTTDKIYGVTTAASIWVFAILGLIIGAGQYIIGISLYAALWLVILMDKYFEFRGIGSYQRKLVIKVNRMVADKEVQNILLIKTKKYKLISMDLNKKENEITFSYMVEGRKETIKQLPRLLWDKEWVSGCKFE
jgi:putative Mg2+ transporter-C (MgtC) family protein